MAEFAAGANNDLKHADRESRPTNPELYAAMRLMVMAAQGQLLLKLAPGDEAFGSFLELPAVSRVHEVFTLNGIRVNDRGKVLGPNL